MSGVEALARLLFIAANAHMPPAWHDMAWADMGGSEPADERAEYEMLAERILADPGPLLAALAEAAVLTEVYSLARHDPQPHMGGPRVQHAGESPDRSVMERVAGLPRSEGRWVERRYVTEWRPANVPASGPRVGGAV